MPNTHFATGHVGLNVTDLGRSKGFYESVFGFETLGESTDPSKPFAFLGKDDEVRLTLWQQSVDSFNKSCAGLHHLSFMVKDQDELKRAEQNIKELGARFHYDGIVPHREGAPSGGIYFEDPDGIRLEIFTVGLSGEEAAPHGEAPSCGMF